jgi:4-amino-4-deoxy-L-arabinose transferase-like glycosyltransferase
MFLPALVVSGGVAIYLIVNFRGLGNFVFFWLGAGIMIISGVILYRVTRNYISRRRHK